MYPLLDPPDLDLAERTLYSDHLRRLVVGSVIRTLEELVGREAAFSQLTQSVREQPVREITAHLVRQVHFQLKARMQAEVAVAREQLVQLQRQ